MVVEGSPTGRSPEPCTAPLLGCSCFLNSAPWCFNGEDRGKPRASSHPGGPTVGRGSQGSPQQAACLLGPTQARAQVLPSKNSLFCTFPTARPAAGPGQQLLNTERARTQRHFTFCSRGVIPAPAVRPRVRQGATPPPPPAPQARHWLTARSPLGHPRSGVLRAHTPPTHARPVSSREAKGPQGHRSPRCGAAGGIAKSSLSTRAGAPSPVLGPPRHGPSGLEPGVDIKATGEAAAGSRATMGEWGSFLSKPGAEPGEGPAPAPQLWQEGAYPEVQGPWNLRHSLDPAGGAGGSW